jgi:hypothetical protein
MSQGSERTAVAGEADVLALEVVVRLVVLKTVLLLLLQGQLFLLLFFLLEVKNVGRKLSGLKNLLSSFVSWLQQK